MKQEGEKIDVIGVIPARYSSTRFEAKVLADICGKPMIQHVWERAKQSLLLDDLIVACDDERIAERCRAFGAKVAMTAKGHASGSDRIAEVINPLDVKVILNIQGDEPLVHPTMIDTVASALINSPDVYMATLMTRIHDPAAVADPHVVKVVVDKNSFALYFSRSPIPFHGHSSDVREPAYYKHIGLYGYTKDFLFTFKKMAPSNLEKTEKLEQLRVLEEGYRIKVLETKYDTVGVDTPEDLERVRAMCREKK